MPISYERRDDQTNSPFRARGPAAIVTTDDEMYRRACLYVAMSRPQPDSDVFRDVDEAEGWLTSRLAAAGR
jgi:hypothetical protein